MTIQIMIIATAALVGGVIAVIHDQLSNREDNHHERALKKMDRRGEMEEREVDRLAEQRMKAEAEAEEAKQKTIRVQNKAQLEKEKRQREQFHAEQDDPAWISDENGQMTRPVNGTPVTQHGASLQAPDEN